MSTLVEHWDGLGPSSDHHGDRDTTQPWAYQTLFVFASMQFSGAEDIDAPEDRAMASAAAQPLEGGDDPDGSDSDSSSSSSSSTSSSSSSDKKS